MSSKPLYIFIEGNDDEDFVNTVIKPLFRGKHIIPWKYSQKEKSKINGFIKSIQSMGADYIFMTDFDEKDCLKSREDEVLQKFSSLNQECIAIVKNEIESWYIAGINKEIKKEKECSKSLRKISVPDDTEIIKKEDFLDLMPINFNGSKIDFMQEILKCYDISIAKRRNNSFKRFISNFIDN